MGNYINLGNFNFKEALADEFIDKSDLIDKINSTLGTKRKMTCVTRCRRFGKSTAADMLCAYYDKSCDSRDLFHGLNIEKYPSFEIHLNKYSVIFLSLSSFTSKYNHDKDIVNKIQRSLIEDIKGDFYDVDIKPDDDLMDFLIRISLKKDEKFFMIIDEWDAIMREFNDVEPVMDRYVKFLHRLFKDPNTGRVFVGAYITGILPIPKDKTQSALNNFKEYTIFEPGPLACNFGFTTKEVQYLCSKYNRDFEEMKKWYDGYQIGDQPSIYNPNSVMDAIHNKTCRNYWRSTGAYETVSDYIKRNYDGLKDDLISMVCGGECPVDYTRFSNDLEKVYCKDDVFTLLIHLGYLAYNPNGKKCYIPNLEVKEEIIHAIQEVQWNEVVSSIQRSDLLMRALLSLDNEAVANGIEKVHQKGTSILSYNDENSLACVMTLAFYAAQDDYIIHRELASGKGYADLIFMPKVNVNKPAIIMELKCNKDTLTAIQQIQKHEYVEKVKEYTTDILIVGINYDLKTKKHTCEILKY